MIYSVFNSVNYQSILLNLISLAPPPKLYLYLALKSTDWINTYEFFRRKCLLACKWALLRENKRAIVGAHLLKYSLFFKFLSLVVSWGLDFKFRLGLTLGLIRVRVTVWVNGGGASSWDYGQKLKKHLKYFFAIFQLSTIYGFWDISFQSWEIYSTVLPVEK